MLSSSLYVSAPCQYIQTCLRPPLTTTSVSALPLPHSNGPPPSPPSVTPQPPNTQSEVQGDIAQRKVFLQGPDRQGRGLAILHGRKHTLTDNTQSQRFISLTIDGMLATCDHQRNPQGKIVAVFELQGVCCGVCLNMRWLRAVWWLRSSSVLAVLCATRPHVESAEEIRTLLSCRPSCRPFACTLSLFVIIAFPLQKNFPVSSCCCSLIHPPHPQT